MSPNGIIICAPLLGRAAPEPSSSSQLQATNNDDIIIGSAPQPRGLSSGAIMAAPAPSHGASITGTGNTQGDMIYPLNSAKLRTRLYHGAPLHISFCAGIANRADGAKQPTSSQQPANGVKPRRIKSSLLLESLRSVLAISVQ